MILSFIFSLSVVCGYDKFVPKSFILFFTLCRRNFTMSDYQLIAFDQATLARKTVILNTGRCPAELEEYFALPDLTYVNCVSGALVYNHTTRETIYSRTLSVDTVKILLSVAAQEDIMIHLLSTQSVVQKNFIPRMADYHMKVYQEMYARVTSPVL